MFAVVKAGGLLPEILYRRRRLWRGSDAALMSGLEISPLGALSNRRSGEEPLKVGDALRTNVGLVAYPRTAPRQSCLIQGSRHRVKWGRGTAASGRDENGYGHFRGRF